jgi:hypothetical protein
VELLEHLCSLEEFFIRSGELQPEYALLFAQTAPKSAGLGPSTLECN